MGNKQYAFDSRLEHRAVGAAALTATATLDTISQRVAMRTEFVTKVYLEAITINDDDELYQVVVELSNDDFTTTYVAAVHDFGATEVRLSGAPDSAAGDSLEFIWHTEYNGQTFKDARIRMVIAGTSPSITASCWSGVVGI
jgi:hypothetical protein